MILYLDTSAFLKLYVEETESVNLRRQVAAADLLATSRLTWVEAMSALARRRRDQTLTDQELREVAAAIHADWEDYLVLDIDEEVAAELVLRHPLRTLDAIHVAAALGLMRAQTEAETSMLSVDLCFVSFDARQDAAAQAEGLRSLPGARSIRSTGV